MRPYMLYSPSRSELELLRATMAFLLKKRGSDQLPGTAQRLAQLQACLEDPTSLQLLVCDVTTSGVLPILEQLRSANAGLRMVLVADNSVSPVCYIRPTILPTALLWRPIREQDSADTLWEVLRGIPDRRGTAEAPEDAFRVEVRGVVRRVPYGQILFFEACNKRLSLHSDRSEIPFPGTLEKLAGELPEGFLRVHKSYIVNRAVIRQIRYGTNEIELEDGSVIPVSRSYKSALKAVFT